MAKTKIINLEIPEQEHLVIPVHDWRDKEGFMKWYDELEPRIVQYWKGRKVRFIEQNEIKEIVEVSFFRSAKVFPWGDDNYFTTFVFNDNSKDEYIAYYNIVEEDLYELI